MKLSRKQRERILSLLPSFLKKIRYNEQKGKMSELSYKDEFIYDRGIFSKLKGGYSQYGQDLFIYKMLMNQKKEGFFLDIGGNDPIEINNSFLFEKNGWSGLAFEPVSSLAKKWENTRETECLNIALGDEECEVQFVEDGALSGIRESGKYGSDNVDNKYIVKQRKLSNVLAERGITDVDVMFIDVEGFEMRVLQGIDFDVVEISVICLENNEDSDLKADMSIRKFLIEKGYRLIGRLTIDDIFVKDNFL